jgi:V-type H+-transporting ATPase subunit a
MGIFSIYCGLIYNDFLSMNLNLFKSCYNLEGAASGEVIRKDESCIYPFGLDPVWGRA